MKLYLAGPMRGIPEFNFPAFARYAAQLRSQGHEVFSPAERNIAKVGDISKGNLTGDNAVAEQEHGFNLREALKDDMMYICLEADGIAIMPGWENSKGARAERATAEALGLKVVVL